MRLRLGNKISTLISCMPTHAYTDCKISGQQHVNSLHSFRSSSLEYIMSVSKKSCSHVQACFTINSGRWTQMISGFLAKTLAKLLQTSSILCESRHLHLDSVLAAPLPSSETNGHSTASNIIQHIWVFFDISSLVARNCQSCSEFL